MKHRTRLFGLALMGVLVASLCGCSGQQESPTLNKSDTPPAMGKSVPATAPGNPTKPKLVSPPPP